MFHWSEQKIRVHAFYCVLALATAHLMRRQAKQAGVNALAAAAAEHVALRMNSNFPFWSSSPSRRLTNFWYPGFDALFANALAHTPISFSNRGVFIESDSLESV